VSPRSGRCIPGKDTRYSLCRRLGEPRGQSEQVRKFGSLLIFEIPSESLEKGNACNNVVRRRG
jgi:hypothetical protein